MSLTLSRPHIGAYATDVQLSAICGQADKSYGATRVGRMVASVSRLDALVAYLTDRGAMSYPPQSTVITGAGSEARAPRLLDEVRRRLRLKRYSLRTEAIYTGCAGSSWRTESVIRARWRGRSRGLSFRVGRAWRRCCKHAESGAVGVAVSIPGSVADRPAMDGDDGARDVRGGFPRFWRGTKCMRCWHRWRAVPGCWPASCMARACA